MSKASRIKHHTIGQVRYFTYYLEFPDGERWQDQSPFVGNLGYLIKTTQFYKKPEVLRGLMMKGSAHWKDHNGVTHRVIIEDEARPRIWGAQASKRRF
jgi:hypothetical protein